jgi:hypothetical protein
LASAESPIAFCERCGLPGGDDWWVIERNGRSEHIHCRLACAADDVINESMHIRADVTYATEARIAKGQPARTRGVLIEFDKLVSMQIGEDDALSYATKLIAAVITSFSEVPADTRLLAELRERVQTIVDDVAYNELDDVRKA